MEAKTCHNPDSLYKQCVGCYVKGLRKDVKKLDEVDTMKNLPPIVLADIYLMVSYIVL